ncbi:hypothetical protein [Kitasatospora sp. MBT63]|uniref:hypothetical protein n=1 Tax=Kitasatospora sp. MBT63 TaxID=1444768 RepID=UPI00053AAB4C|nr:hypothetical protein [Kitasatospora sp. MBT63]
MSDGTGIAQVDTLVVWCVAGAAITGALGLLWRLTRGVRAIAHQLDQVAEDWSGTPARPGVPARAGVMERLGQIESRLGAVEHELHPNSGASLRDAVDRVERSVCASD